MSFEYSSVFPSLILLLHVERVDDQATVLQCVRQTTRANPPPQRKHNTYAHTFEFHTNGANNDLGFDYLSHVFDD